MIIEFEDLTLPHISDPCSGRAEFDYDEYSECVFLVSVDLDETPAMVALSLDRKDVGLRQQWFSDIERVLIQVYGDELDGLVPQSQSRFDPRREWGTYWGRP